MNARQKLECLTTSLKAFQIPEKYFIHTVNKPNNILFVIASKKQDGGIETHTGFMNYDKMNAYLLGYFRHKTNPLT